jgi:hypothetical protein
MFALAGVFGAANLELSREPGVPHDVQLIYIWTWRVHVSHFVFWSFRSYLPSEVILFIVVRPAHEAVTLALGRKLAQRLRKLARGTPAA